MVLYDIPKDKEFNKHLLSTQHCPALLVTGEQC